MLSLDHLPTTPCSGIHLGQKMHLQIREGPGSGQASKRKQDNWPKESQDLGELSYGSGLNHLSGALLIQGDPRTFAPLCVCYCFASALDKQTHFLCGLPFVVLCL